MEHRKKKNNNNNNDKDNDKNKNKQTKNKLHTSTIYLVHRRIDLLQKRHVFLRDVVAECAREMRRGGAVSIIIPANNGRLVPFHFFAQICVVSLNELANQITRQNGKNNTKKKKIKRDN
jgi:hypothetical protein